MRKNLVLLRGAVLVATGLAWLPASAGTTVRWPMLRAYRGAHLRCVKMPIGGIGTGAISLSGTGGLGAFEIRNVAEKNHIPCRQSVFPAFVLRTENETGEVSARLLEGPLDKTLYEGAFGCPAPNHGYPRFGTCVFRAAYPLAHVELSDDAVPVKATLEAMNPLVKGDAEASGMPVALLRWRLANTSGAKLKVTVAAAMPNPCDGALSQSAAESARLRGVVFRGNADKEGEKSPLNRKTGEFAVTVPASAGAVTVGVDVRHAGWSDGLDQFWRRLVEKGDVGDMPGREKCDFGTLAVTVELNAGETKAIPFALAWRFPNRTQWEWTENGFYETINHVGNHYCIKYPTALAAAEELFARLDELEAKTAAFVDSVVAAPGVPAAVKEAALFNLSTLRSPTCFRTADGHFFGWEGTGDAFGSCYGNCTHVWGYEHALVDIWPDLAKDMRDVEFMHAMSEEGAIAFRIGLPLDRNARNHKKAAADGQMQSIIKAYECWAKTGDDAWMRKLYPHVRKALEFCWVEHGWDADKDGVMEGCQHNTMDVDYYGPNPQMEFLYLAALQAVERLAAKFDGDRDFAATCADLRARGSAWTEKNLFNGAYYEQIIASAEGEFHPLTKSGWTTLADLKNPDFQLGPGCLIDQLVGDYAARCAGLEPVADVAHARTATGTILKNNRREPDAPLFNHMRDFALAGERSLVMAWYPPARRPKTPFPYYPESMTGFEYVVAAWLAQTGDCAASEEVVRDIRDRYDGEKRNPFDEAECGHHYARALAAWSVFRAFQSARAADARYPANATLKTAGGPLVQAHRGGRGEYDDNAAGGFRKSLENGIRGFETDVRFTKDRRLVIMHDEDVARTTDGKGKVEEMTLGEFRKLRLKTSGEAAPTLEDVLAVLAGRDDIFIEIEMKVEPSPFYTPETLEAYCRALDETARRMLKPGTYAFTCFSQDTLAAMRRVDAQAPLGYITSEGLSNKHLETARKLGCASVAPRGDHTTKEMIDRAHADGIGVCLWMCESKKAWRDFAARGADRVTSDHPVQISAARAH